jgi:peptide/nickel transport system permease protein
VALGTGSLAVFSRFVRSEVLEVLSQDYVRTARAKGLREQVVVTRHALRNALLPVITIFGALIPGLFAGAALTESVFAWPGLGQAAVDAARARDYPIVLGITMFLATLTIFGNLLADILYGFVDPRVRYD